MWFIKEEGIWWMDVYNEEKYGIVLIKFKNGIKCYKWNCFFWNIFRFMYNGVKIVCKVKLKVVVF